MEGSLCPVCGYSIPLTPPKGPKYAIVTTGGWMANAFEKEKGEEALIRYCGLNPEYAEDYCQQIRNYDSFVLLRRGLDDRAAQWLASHLDHWIFKLKIVEDRGETEESLLLKERALELPSQLDNVSQALEEKPMSFGTTVLAVAVGVIAALIFLSIF